MSQDQGRIPGKFARSGGLTLGEWLSSVDLRLKLSGFDFTKISAGLEGQDLHEQFRAGKTPEEVVAVLVALQRAAHPPAALG